MSGFHRLQESRVRALGFADWCGTIYIDALDQPNRRGKQRLSGPGLRAFLAARRAAERASFAKDWRLDRVENLLRAAAAKLPFTL